MRWRRQPAFAARISARYVRHLGASKALVSGTDPRAGRAPTTNGIRATPTAMSLVSALLALLLPAATEPEPLSVMADVPLPLAEIQRVPPAEQIRIEQRITIRIAPRRPSTPPEMSYPAPGRPRLVERHTGKCVPTNAIGVTESWGRRANSRIPRAIGVLPIPIF